MPYHHLDPDNPRALPDVEVFEWTDADARAHDPYCTADESDWRNEPGWYAWFCFPGCLPDGEPWGPCATDVAALECIRAAYLD